MGALDSGIDKLGHLHGAGAPERVRQGGHRAWLPDPGARADPRGGPRTARPYYGAGGDAACSRSERARMSIVCRRLFPDGFLDGGAIPSSSTQPSLRMGCQWSR